MTSHPRLEIDQAVLVLIDVQGKLARLMYEQEALFQQLARMIDGARLFDLPILWLEQLPDKLGPSIEEIQSRLRDETPIVKSSFSAWGADDFRHQLRVLNRRQVLLTGIESHICVTQTCLDLLAEDYEVFTINDAISSRSAENRQTGLHRMHMAGAIPSSVEAALFELQRNAEGDRFRHMAKLFKD